MNRYNSCILVVAFVVVACSPSAKPVYPTSSSLQQTALLLRNSGDHMNASYYLEAALQNSSEEDINLFKRCVEEQILAGRLLAARETLKQLEEFFPQQSSITHLRNAIDNQIGLQSASAKEMTP